MQADTLSATIRGPLTGALFPFVSLFQRFVSGPGGLIRFEAGDGGPIDGIFS